MAQKSWESRGAVASALTSRLPVRDGIAVLAGCFGRVAMKGMRMRMRMRIYEFQLPASPGAYDLEIENIRWLMHCGMQDGKITLWYAVAPASKTVKTLFTVRGTGDAFDDLHETHAGTVQDGRFVWHVFEVTSD